MEVLDPQESVEGHLYKKGWYDWSKRYFRLVGHYLVFYKSKNVRFLHFSSIIFRVEIGDSHDRVPNQPGSNTTSERSRVRG